MLILCDAASRFDKTRFRSFQAFIWWYIPRKLANHFARKKPDTINVGFPLEEMARDNNRPNDFNYDDVEKLNKAMLTLTQKQRDVVYQTVGLGVRARTLSKQHGVTSQAIERTKMCAITNLKISFGLAKREPKIRSKRAKPDTNATPQ